MSAEKERIERIAVRIQAHSRRISFAAGVVKKESAQWDQVRDLDEIESLLSQAQTIIDGWSYRFD